jgi:hypothetical protein
LLPFIVVTYINTGLTSAFTGNEDGTNVAEVTKKISGVLSAMKIKGHLTATKQDRKIFTA